MPDLITQRLTLAKFLGDIEPKYPEWGTALREQFPDTDLEEIPFLRKGFELEDSDLEMVSGERADIATISTIRLIEIARSYSLKAQTCDSIRKIL